MSAKEFSEVLDLIIKKDPRYEKGAYYFLRQALDFTIKKRKDGKGGGSGGHISGQQLLEGIKEFALDQYGPMTMTLLAEWGIKETLDFGEIVFNLVDYGVLGKTEDDNRQDFAGGFDFFDAFEAPFMVANGDKDKK